MTGIVLVIEQARPFGEHRTFESDNQFQSGNASHLGKSAYIGLWRPVSK